MEEPMDDAIQTFGRGDDAAYEQWVQQHAGYVLVERKDGFMLHEATCGHLDLTPGEFTLTSRPRRCAETRQALTDFTQRRTGRRPHLCQSCM
jgi:hypothetical protein